MPFHAGWPTWILVIMVFSFMGPLMRMLFGEAPRRVRHGSRAEEIARLDAALAERDAVIEDLQARLSELESRLDFTERLLASPRKEGAEAAGV
jgi:hypothetical protein